MRTFLVFAALAITSPVYAQFNRGPVVVAEPVWKIESSDNFRVFHSQEGDYGKKVLKLAEEYREEIGKRWFGEVPKFRTKCDVYLQTSLAYGSGATHINYDNGQALAYRIDLRIDLPEVYTAVLPHEIMHALLGAHFGRPLPRWADEGLASQNEPKETQERAKKTVSESKVRFELKTLMSLGDYPRERELFYAQSTVAVNHLVRLRDEKTFILFITDAQKEGPEQALQKHYKVDFAGLEKTWLDVPPPVQVTTRGR